MNKLRNEGYNPVLRSAGSHSSVDICGIREIDRTIKFIQSKPRKMSKMAKKRLENQMAWLNGNFNVRFEVR